MMKIDYYQILGVSHDADVKSIKSRYRFLCNAFHPDKFSTGQREQAEEEFKQLNTAYQVLSVEEKRAAYDAARTYISTSASHSKNEQNTTPSRHDQSHSAKFETTTENPMLFRDFAYTSGGVFSLLETSCKIFVYKKELRFFNRDNPECSFEISSAILQKSTFEIRKRFLIHELNIILPDGKSYKIGLDENSIHRILDLIKNEMKS